MIPLTPRLTTVPEFPEHALYGRHAEQQQMLTFYRGAVVRRPGACMVEGISGIGYGRLDMVGQRDQAVAGRWQYAPVTPAAFPDAKLHSWRFTHDEALLAVQSLLSSRAAHQMRQRVGPAILLDLPAPLDDDHAFLAASYLNESLEAATEGATLDLALLHLLRAASWPFSIRTPASRRYADSMPQRHASSPRPALCGWAAQMTHGQSMGTWHRIWRSFRCELSISWGNRPRLRSWRSTFWPARAIPRRWLTFM